VAAEARAPVYIGGDGDDAGDRVGSVLRCSASRSVSISDRADATAFVSTPPEQARRPAL
jgi:hypothetical protein